ncbi:MAG: hypothetical protein ACI3ZF_06230 [Candidatus Cryptobacteroides sp.]
MKKFGIYSIALAALALVASCKPEKKPGIIDIEGLANGFYISEVGQDLKAENAMDQGKNEVDQSERAGMYEIYLVLEAGKTYQFTNKKGSNADIFGAELEYGETAINTDNVEIAGYKGSLVADGSFQVNTTDLYHIVLDFNEDGNLSDVGGAQCILVPVEWGLAGTINSWGFLAGERKDLTWSWKGVELIASAEFKFKHNDCWKINLDIANLVKANTNLGANCIVGGDNIKPEEAGIYDITLTYVGGTSPATADRFTYTLTKVGESSAKDYSKCELELVGAAVLDGVADPSSWNWGNVVSLGTPSVPTGESKVYTWRIYDVNLSATGGFKVRTINAEASGDIPGFDFGVDGKDITVPADGKYDIVFSIDAATEERTFSCVAPTTELIEVVAYVTGWENPVYVWTWNNAPELVGSFQPCKPQEDGAVKFAFRKNADYPTPGGCLVNGAGWGNGQTGDMDFSASGTYTVAGNGAEKVEAVKK